MSYLDPARGKFEVSGSDGRSSLATVDEDVDIEIDSNVSPAMRPHVVRIMPPNFNPLAL